MGLGGNRSPGMMPQRLLSLAAGALLATAFMHLLPEAFESEAGAHDLFVTLLVGLVFFSCCPRPSCGTTGMSTARRRPMSTITTNITITRATPMTIPMITTTATATAAGPC